MPLDKKQRWYTDLSLVCDYINSRDLNRWSNAVDAASAASTVSTVRSLSFRPTVKLGFRPSRAYDLRASVSAHWMRYTGDRADFTTIRTCRMTYALNATMNLPSGFYVYNELSLNTNHGYSDASLNDTYLVWNVKASKSFSKPGLHVHLTAYDLLRQASDTYFGMNAQGRVESYTRQLKPYGMLGLSWNFSKIVGAKGGKKSPETEGL